jgi:hypothetical protein
MLWIAEGMAESDSFNTDPLSDWAAMADEGFSRAKLEFAQENPDTIYGVYNLQLSEC